MTTTLNVVALLVGLLPLQRMQASAQPIFREDAFVSSDPGVVLFVRHVRGARADGVPILLVHGGGGASLAAFDLSVPGYSVAADLAGAGHPVYLMDVRGFGLSSRLPALDEPADRHPPLVPAAEAARDIAAVVEWIQRRHAGRRVALIGWASDGHWAGLYTTRHNEKVSHLILLNTLYGVAAPWGLARAFEDPERPGSFNRRNAAYREADREALLAAWTRAIPTDAKEQWRHPAVAELYAWTAIASDPTSGARVPPSLRVPGAFREEAYHLARGRKYWEASDIRVPVLVLRGEHDHWSRPEDVEALEADLVNAPVVRTVTIPGATHFLFLDRPERGRQACLREIMSFLRSR
ncbi:MAG TPA: alpha/beta fold hydrolase [Vicinamibacterales bacterium]|nr:alpha/beta fold hydrolase [Vicinamibacterales bacterium]